MLRRGPGLVRTVGRTAVIAGTASAVAGGVSRRQQQKHAGQDAAQAPPPPPPPPPAYEEPAPVAASAASEDSIVDQLKELAALHTAGVLTDAEFEAGKAKLLA